MQLASLLMAGKLTALVSYFSWAYLVVFLPVSIIIYSVLPQKCKKYFLLLASYGFFWLISGKLVAYLLLATVSVHYYGIWIDRIKSERNAALKLAEKESKKALRAGYTRKSRLVLLMSAVTLVGTLLTLKYSPFFVTNINTLLCRFGFSFCLKIPSYAIPIGISFFTLQAVSYVFDVHRGEIKADGNLLRLALFMSFFPQIVEGPICRYEETATQLWNVKQIQFSNLKFGLQRILFGMMKKIVVADRLNPLIEEVFNHHENYHGGVIALAALCYTVQLYMDFSGTMDAVCGTAEIFGVVMPENFQRPFFSKTISEFWKRWHVSLGAWFKDYIFYPLTMSKPMKNLTSKARKKIGNYYGPLVAGSIALFCVWFCNGLWHGSAWSYIFFGMYHYVLILAGSLIFPLIKFINEKLHIKSDWPAYKFLQIVRTCILVVIGELFFRANGLRAGLSMFKRIVTDFSFATSDGSLLTKLGVDRLDFIIVGVAVVIVLVVSILNEKGISLRASLAKSNPALRWAVLYALIMFIVIFGAYGYGYEPVDPIYANF